MAESTEATIVCVCGQVSPAGARFCSSCGRPLAAVRPEAEEERRQVTALFADLSGFTTMAEQVDAEGLVTIVDAVIKGLARIVEGHGGLVATFVGDAVLGLFGAPVAHEDDATRAVRAAAQMHEWLSTQPRAPDRPELTLHIGVNTGTVVARSLEGGGRTQYDVLGEPVIIAQRLEALAPSGQTYVGALTAQLSADAFDFDDLGRQAVKGRVDPVQVFAVRGRHATPARPGSGMVGRDAELAVLVRALRAVRAEGSRVVHIVGAAGSGKSRLLAGLRDHPAGQRALFVEVAAESTAAAPYQSLATLFAAALRARYPDATSSADRLHLLRTDPRAPADHDYTAILLGGSTDAAQLASRDAAEVGRQLARTASAWLDELARTRDVVVAVENVQWLEPSSADLLAALTSEPVRPGVLFCIVSRQLPEPPGDGSTQRVIELTPLDRQDIATLMMDELKLDPDERLVALVHRRSDGNPLMARETVRHLHDTGLLDVGNGYVRLRAGADIREVPDNVRALVAARVDAMPAESVQVLTAAATIGLLVPGALLAAVYADLTSNIEAEIDALIAAGFLTRQPDGDLRFDAPIVRDVLYSRLTRRRREALHARIADAVGTTVTSSGAATALQAEHRFLAGDVSAAVPWLRQTADHARVVHAHDDAVIALNRAIEAVLSPDAPEHRLLPGLLCDLGDVRMELGEYERAAASYDRARDIDHDARAIAGYGASLRRRGHYAQARSELEAGLAQPPTGDARQIWGELSAVLSVSGDLPASLDAARAGLALGRDDDRTAAQLLIQVVRAESLLGELALAREHVERALAILERAGDDVGLCTTLRLLGSVQEMSGELDEAARTLQRGLDLARRIGLVEEIGGCLVNLGLVRGALGDHRAAAESYAQAAVTFERSDNRAGQATAYGNRAYELFVQGDAGARALAMDALALADEVGNRLTSADVHHTLALIAEAEGDRPSAHEQALAAVQDFELAAMPDAAQASRDLARRTAAS